MTSDSDARSPGPLLIIYSRQGCHLCEMMIEALLPRLRGRAELEICDVDTRDDWRVQYGERVPVLTLNGRTVCEYRLDTQALERMLDGRGAGIGAQPDT